MTEQKESTLAYKQGDEGYNRQSGKKTLLLVGVCLALVVILLAIMMYFFFQNSRVMIK